MTEIPKVGDRVRINQRPIEGVVRERAERPGHYAVFSDAAAVYYLGQLDRPTYGLEVLERAVEPFLDGTVVLSSDKVTVYRHDGRWWSTRTGKVSHFTDKLVRGSLGGLGYMKLIHEPQAR